MPVISGMPKESRSIVTPGMGDSVVTAGWSKPNGRSSKFVKRAVWSRR